MPASAWSALFRPLLRDRAALALTALLLTSPVSAGPSLPARFDLVQLASDPEPYSEARGFGFDRDTRPTGDQPFYFSVAVPEGNYRVGVTLGGSAGPSDTTVKAESRQLMLQHVVTSAGETVVREFVVNVRTPRLPPPEKNAPGGSAVLLNERERGLWRWDDKLTLEFSGPAPRVLAINIESAPAVPTVFLAGDSTVTDQPFEPGASWGQMLPRFLKADIAVANHAESGETLKSFLSELRLAKILSVIRPGDYLFIQFGHNDEKRNWPQTYVDADTTYRAYLRVYIAEARLRGAIPVLVTSMQRRTFDEHGRIRNTHGTYPEAVRAVAREQNVALVDLDQMSTVFYEALGPDRSTLAFSNDGKDITHHNNYGAYELAKCVVEGMRQASPPLPGLALDDLPAFDPAHPDAPETFALPASPLRSSIAPRGN